MSTEILLKVKDLSKTYPNGVQALRKVNFEVKKGEFLVIIGLSGSGKSTLLRCLNRLHDPSDGEIWLGGKNVTGVTGSELLSLRRRVAMIFQHFNLVPRHSVLNQVLMGRLAYTPLWRSLLGWFKAEDVQHAYELLKMVGIRDKAMIRADQLSGGQQQRVAIARALAQEPAILLADEPVASLDPATCHTVMDHLRELNQKLGLTIICNLHFLSLVREYATRVIALKAGEIVYEGSPQSIDEAWFERIYGHGAQEVRIR